nr:MAG TPA: hypothetical protein [Caudoviricetes sp.]
MGLILIKYHIKVLTNTKYSGKIFMKMNNLCYKHKHKREMYYCTRT